MQFAGTKCVGGRPDGWRSFSYQTITLLIPLTSNLPDVEKAEKMEARVLAVMGKNKTFCVDISEKVKRKVRETCNRESCNSCSSGEYTVCHNRSFTY